MFLPKNTNRQTVVMMNPSCTPTIRLPFTFMHKMLIECRESIRHRYVARWIRKGACNLWYTFANVPYNVRMIVRLLRDPVHLPAVTARRVWVVNAQYDPWTEALPRSEAFRQPHYVFLSHGGIHDGLWLQAGACADIVQSAYGA